MSNMDPSVQQAMAAFEHQLSQERDKGMADGARLFLYRFKETHGCTPLDALEGGRIAAREANLGLQWGKAACAYIAELEEKLSRYRAEEANPMMVIEKCPECEGIGELCGHAYMSDPCKNCAGTGYLTPVPFL